MPRQIERFAGDVTAETYGQQPGDATYVVVPIRIKAQTAEQAGRFAEIFGGLISRIVGRLPYAHWITTETEASLALMANLTTALDRLTPIDRLAVFMASPDVEKLRQLIDTGSRDVVECRCGASAPANDVLRLGVVEAIAHRPGCEYRRDTWPIEDPGL